VKEACGQAVSKGVALGSCHGEVQEDEVEVDLNLLLEKERNKIINQRTRNTKKAKNKAKKEARKALDKAEKEER
jgi:hypothetical protein